MFKRFSTREVSDALVSTLVRFPFAIAAAMLGTALAVWFIEQDSRQRIQEQFAIGVMVCLLALPFLVSLKLISESRGWNVATDIGVQLGGVGLLVLYWFLLPDKIDGAPEKHWFRYGALLFAAHLLSSFAPFIRKGHNTAFWHFNQQMFFRWLIGALYAGVLFGGIAAALAAVDALFNVKIRGERYGEWWVVCVGLFHPLFFLSGVPRTFVNADHELNYPKMLRWFCVYILVPIVFVYLAILYAYFGKIGIEWNFPRGWVANLGLGFSVTGILAVLLVYPLRERDDQPFIRLYYRWYFVLLIPVVALVLLAIGKRLTQYGFTEERYTVLALTCWLGLVAFYFIAVSRHRIKVVPITLFVIALASAWLMSPVSRSSQTQRLQAFLEKENMLDNDGKIKKPIATIGDSSQMEISRITRYLSNVHSAKSLQPMFAQNVDSIVNNVEPYQQEDALVEAMGIEYRPYGGSTSSSYFDFDRNDTRVFDVRGYEAMLHLHHYAYSRDGFRDTVRVLNEPVTVKYNEDYSMDISLPDGGLHTFDVNGFATRIFSHYGFQEPPDSVMHMTGLKNGYRFRLDITNMHGNKVGDSLILNGYDGYLLIGTTQ